MKSKLRVRAIELRKRGMTYSEISREVPVAKSTLSLWFRSVGLSKRQKQRLTKKKLAAARRGGRARKKQRLEITKRIKEKAHLEIGKINDKNLFLMGSVLYWAEGTKSKKCSPSQGVIFSNLDFRMIKVFLKWLRISLKIPDKRIKFEIIIHDTHKERVEIVRKYWAQKTGFSIDKFDKIYFKRNKIKTNRKNVGQNYYGLLRVSVSKSTNLNRKITGWIEGVCVQCGMV